MNTVTNTVMNTVMNTDRRRLTTYAALDAYIARQMQQLNLPGAALAVVEGERIVHQRGFGRATRHGATPTAQTPFFIGSLTKSMTALAIMQLVEEGKVALDAPVQRYLPWFGVADPQASAQISVRHLLHQTSGLPTSAGETPLADFDAAPGATERQARALASVKLAHAPGASFAYCNMNYNLLGLVIEAASGQAYADYMHQHLFAPLEMRHTFTTKDQAAANGLAVGHQLWFWLAQPAPDLPAPLGSLPSGQLISCAEDMAHYLIALLNGGRCGHTQILSSGGVAELQRGVAEVRQWGLSLGSYAMGWFVGAAGAEPLIWHTGNVPDFSAYMALLPAQRTGVVLLANAGHHMMVPACAELGAGAAALLSGQAAAGGGFGLRWVLPWVMRSLLLVPLFQLAGVWAALRHARRRRSNAVARPQGASAWARHALLPLLANLLPAALLIPVLGPRRGYLRLFLPDFAWTAWLCGAFALAWGVARTGLMIWALREERSRV